MTKNEFLMDLYRQKATSYASNFVDFYANPATGRIDPFKIADQLYYVGDKNVCVHLIDTGDGLILLDSGYLGATHLLVDSIWRAGFDPKNVKWIIHSHGHSDHFGSSEEFRIMYGTKLAISRVDAEAMRLNPDLYIAKSRYPLAKIPDFDYEIEDGEIFELGNMKIRCMLTPGHTDGVLSFFFDVTYNGQTYLAGMFGGAGINAITLPYIVRNKRSDDCDRQMLASVKKLKKEPVVVHIGNHPYNNKTMEKRAKMLREGGNPFIAPESWQNSMDEIEKTIEVAIRQNESLRKQISELE